VAADLRPCAQPKVEGCTRLPEERRGRVCFGACPTLDDLPGIHHSARREAHAVALTIVDQISGCQMNFLALGEPHGQIPIFTVLLLAREVVSHLTEGGRAKQGDTRTVDEPAQLILIDIDDFGSINNRYGHQKGTDVIRMIAQSILQGMRRDEEIYTPRGAELYRRLAGGDEFLFLLRGQQFEAVGFLTRLHASLGKLSAKVKEQLGIDFSISFHGAIAPIYQKDSYRQAVGRLEECFVEAKKETSNRKVYW
jgi:diguanylate cyclase (GGDEF)-like protein